MSEAIQNPDKQDYDNPWKLALDDYLDEFMVFYFPDGNPTPTILNNGALK